MVEPPPDAELCGAELASVRAELLARLRAGGDAAWLTTGEVAMLFAPSRRSKKGYVERSTVHAWIADGKISYTKTPGGRRRCNPADVLALLEQAGEVRRGGESSGEV